MRDMLVLYFFLFVLSYLSARVVLPAVFVFLTDLGAVKKNWQGQVIPCVAGIAFPFIVLLAGLPIFIYKPVESNMAVKLLALMGVCLLGLLDDTYGDLGPKGLKGHFRYLWQQKKPTTGVLKAAGTAIIAAWAVYKLEAGLLEWLLLTLNVNTINLLDLRPGRAVKGTVFLLMLALIWGLQDYALFSIAGGLLLAYAGYDLSGRVMLGDTGSNTLGLISGFVLLGLPAYAKLMLVLLFAGFHLLTEKYSFSLIIERSNILSRIDRWGQK